MSRSIIMLLTKDLYNCIGEDIEMKKRNLLIVALSLIMLMDLAIISTLADDIVVAFEKKEYTILVGKNASIIPVVQGTKQKGKMIYASSNEDIATVNNGKVTGHKAGTVTISCTATIENESFECSYDLTVLQPIKKIEVPKGTIELPSNCKMKESAIHILPEDASNTKLEFKSSNTKVANISSDGIISTGSEGGTATITCKATDGSNVKATITVKVPKTAWFFSKKYEIDDPDGIDFLYKPTASYFLSEEYCSNDNISMSSVEAKKDDIPDDLPFVFTGGGKNILRKVHIKPLKTGKSNFVYDGFMVSKESVSITVNRSAVYEKLDYGKCLKSAEKNKGLKFCVDGTYFREENLNGIRSVYLACDGDETKPVKIILSEHDKTEYKNGERRKINASLVGLDDFVSETGLKKQILVFEKDSIYH